MTTSELTPELKKIVDETMAAGRRVLSFEAGEKAIMEGLMTEERMAEIEARPIRPKSSLLLCAAERGELLQAVKAERKTTKELARLLLLGRGLMQEHADRIAELTGELDELKTADSTW